MMVPVNHMNYTNLSTSLNKYAVNPLPEWQVKLDLAVSIIILVVGIAGNILVLLTLKLQRHRAKKHRPPYEYFFGNLSIADLVYLAAYLIGNYAIKQINFFVCVTLSPLASISATVSMHTITAIAVFRAKAISDPFHFKPGRKTVYGTIIGIWFTATVVYIPLYLTLTYDKKTENCKENWPSQIMNKVYTVALFVVQYPIPLTIIVISYVRIVLHLKRNTITQENEIHLARKRRQDKEILKISIAIVILYTVLTLPAQIVWLSLMVFEDHSVALTVLLFSGHLFLSHCCCNPLVYGSISSRFRAPIIGFARFTYHCCCCSRNRKTRTIPINDRSVGEVNGNMVELTAITIQTVP